MKLVNVITARSIWLFDTRELNPRGKRVYPEVFTPLIQRYGFQLYPTRAQDLNSDAGVVFQNGGFQTPDGMISMDLTCYVDGLVAASRSSTEHTDAFIDDALQWTSKEFGFRYDPAIVRNKIYVSEINIEADPLLHRASERLQEFSSYLSALENGKSDQQLVGVSFDSDPVSGSLFTFERKLNTPLSENRYYSRARLPTPKHVEALEKFGEMLS